MMSLRKELAALDAVVAFGAAANINSGLEHYTCLALRHTVDPTTRMRKSTYEQVYERWKARQGFGFLPRWWSAGAWHYKTHLYRIQREEALIDFAHAILEAQQPSSWDKLKKWLVSSCEYGVYS